MPFRRVIDLELRELLKQKRREQQAKRKAALVADPRFQAAKQAQKDRRRAANDAAKARRKEMAKERRLRER